MKSVNFGANNNRKHNAYKVQKYRSEKKETEFKVLNTFFVQKNK